jgi:hypothetical protein
MAYKLRSLSTSGKLVYSDSALWGVNHLAGLVSKERPSYLCAYCDQTVMELDKLVDIPPFKPYTPY